MPEIMLYLLGEWGMGSLLVFCISFAVGPDGAADAREKRC